MIVLAVPLGPSRVIVALEGVPIGLPVSAWAAAERPRVAVLAIARLDVSLPPVVITIAFVRAVAASTAGRVDVPLVVAGVVVARVEIHIAPFSLSSQALQ